MKIIIVLIAICLPYVALAGKIDDLSSKQPTALVNKKFNETISVLADPWCPYNCQPQSEKPGFGVELARSIFADQGIELIYILKDWQQSLDAVRAGHYDAIISAYKSDAPDFIYPSIHYSYAQTCLFSRKNSTWRYTGSDSLNEGRQVLGVMRGYSYGINIDQYINQHKNDGRVKVVDGLDVLDKLINLLDAGKVDVLIEDKNVFRHRLLTHSNKNGYQVVGCQPRAKLFFGFSPANLERSKKYSKILENGLIKALMSGQARKISDSYGIKHE